MDASTQIREAMARVASLRQIATKQPALAQAVQDIKLFQAQRFSGTYPDLLNSPQYAPSASFFLEELYSARDFSDRDAQFSRIAGALELTFPVQVAATAVALAQLHGLTEELDLAMAQCWLQSPSSDPATRYVQAWRSVGQRAKRNWQLTSVQEIGQTLSRLTAKRGLRLLLKMMRKPAQLAGLGSLQGFLELGFDHFASMAQAGGAAQVFLATIQTRELQWLSRLFDAPEPVCKAALNQALNSAAHQTPG